MNKITRLTLAVAVSMCASTMLAQNTNSGDIRGTVTDKSGAVIPDATVSVEDIDKNITKTFTTNGDGLYDTGSINADHYIITYSKTGFSTVVRGPVTVEVGQTAINAELAVGATSQRVVVNTNVPLLKTETGEQSTTFTGATMEQLPQVGSNGPDWNNFIVLMPGTTGTPMSQAGIGASAGIQSSVNGNLPYTDVLADGNTATLPMSQNSAFYIFDTVAELKVESSSFSAQYGVGGIIYNQISKGGSSQYHGEVYEYFQDNVMNAAPYAFGNPGKPAVPVLTFRNYGFNVGGPILKKKMFFFFDYDKTTKAGGSNPSTQTVPTAASKLGDFTGQAPIYDPLTSVAVNDAKGNLLGYSRTQFVGNKIPTNRLDPVAQNINAYFPNPTSTSLTNNFVFNGASTSPFKKYFGRLDYDITAKNRLTATDLSTDNPAQFLQYNQCPVNCQSGDVSNDNAQVSDVWSASNKLTNEFRYGFTDQLNFFQPYSLNKGFPAKLNLTLSKADIFPQLNINNYLNLAPQSNSVYKEFAYDPSDVVTLIEGKHVLHFGGEFLMDQANATAWGNTVGANLNFDGSYTNTFVPTPAAPGPYTGGAYTGGSGYADFLLGYASGWSALVKPEFGGRTKLPMLFLQDDIQLRPNLTVNVGIRWQGDTGWTEVKGNEISFDPTLVNPADGSKGAVWYGNAPKASQGGRSRLMAPVWNDFLPRAGFSYQATSNTVVRGGAGLYAYTWSTDTYAQGLGGAFGYSGNYNDQSNHLYPVVILSQDGSVVDQKQAGGTSINAQYIGPSVDPAYYNGKGAPVYQQYHTPVPKITQYNLQVQRELGNNLVAEVGYVGSHAFNLVYNTDLNQIHAGNLVAAGTSANLPSLRPFHNFTSIGGRTNNGISNYNSLQAELQKRMANGLSFDANYTWSHFLDNQDSSGWGSHSGPQDWQIGYDPSSNYGNSNFDVRHAVKGNAVYELPIGKGQRFLNNNVIVDELIGGWQASTTVVWQTGNPFTVIMNNNNDNSQAGEQFASVVAGQNPNSGPKTVGPNGFWYNKNAFTATPSAAFGNEHRNQVRGPHYSDVSLAVAKTFPIWKTIAAYISISADNVLNHPSFGTPDNKLDDSTPGVVNSVTNGGRTMQLVGKIMF